MLTTEETKEIVAKFGGSDKNSGSAEVQVALMTARIKYLTKHFESNKKDHHSMTGLKKLIGRRRSMLGYIKKNNEDSYKKLIKELGLRR